MLWRTSLALQARRTLVSAASESHAPLALARAKFVDAVNSTNKHAILSSYRLLRSMLVTSESPSNSHFPDEDTLLRAMSIMSHSTVKNETNIAFIIYADLSSIFSSRITPKHQSVYVQALLSRGWLEQARQRLTDYPAQVADFNLVIDAYIRAGKQETALEIFQELIRSRLDPDEQTYRMVLQCLSTGSNPQTLKAVTGAMDTYLSSHTARSHFSKFFWPTLLTMFARRTAPTDLAATKNETGESSVGPRATQAPSQLGDSISQTRSLDALRGASKASDLKQLKETPNPSHWALLIHNAAHQKGLPAAVDVYNTAKESGISPTFEMILPLVQHSCDRRVRSSEDQHLTAALRFYREAFSTESGTGSKTSSVLIIRRVYEVLLRTLVDTNTPSTSFPLSLALLRDMMALDVTFASSAAERMLVMLIRTSPSHDAAYEIYSSFKEQHANELEESVDDSALMAFLHLTSKDQPFPPVSLFFLLLNDMQRRGYAWSKRAYTVMLSRISDALKRDKMIVPSGLLAIQHVHKRLLLDTNLSPDTPLLNALMNAYNHADAPAEALKVWETLFIQNKHDNTSLSIVLDTLSHAGATREAAVLISKMKHAGFALDRDNWQSWLELLCRADKIEQAARLVCFDMKRSEPPITPDIDHIETLLKYAWNVGKRGEIQAKIRKYLPAIWNGLPDRLRE
jgi:pentatricopeptide repeat protein